MEKYIFILILICFCALALCTFSVFDMVPDNVYVITSNPKYAKNLKISAVWSTNEYFVFKLSDNTDTAKNVPNSTVIKEYKSKNANMLNRNSSFMQVYASGQDYICGIPYIID